MPEIQFSDDDPAYQEVIEGAAALGISPAEYIRLAVQALTDRNEAPDS